VTYPAGACDTHIHVYDAGYPTAATATLFPPDAGTADYRRIQQTLGLDRVVMVQPTTYGFDNRCQLGAAATFGPDGRAVVVIDERATTEELERLHTAGARGARFHMLPGGAVAWSSLQPTAARIHELGWHVQLQLDGNRLSEHVEQLLALPTPIVVDHVGRFMPPPPPDDPAVDDLLRLIDAGRCWVKLSAPYESTRDGAPAYPTVTAIVDRLVAAAPERMLWATNWPHPGQADPPTTTQLGDLADRWLPTDGLRHQVLVENPMTVYGFEPVLTESTQT
jgi:D-galactarolactone isomerase